MRRERIAAGSAIHAPLLAGPFAGRTIEAQNEEAAIFDMPLRLSLGLELRKVTFTWLRFVRAARNIGPPFRAGLHDIPPWLASMA